MDEEVTPTNGLATGTAAAAQKEPVIANRSSAAVHEASANSIQPTPTEREVVDLSDEPASRAPSGATSMYSPTTRRKQNQLVTWHHVPDLGTLKNPSPPPRLGHRALIHGHMMITFSGGDGTMFEDLNTFDIRLKQWAKPTVRGNIPKGRMGYGMDIYGDQIILFGGMKENSTLSSDVYELDTFGWEWSKLKPSHSTGWRVAPLARFGHSFTTVNGRIYLFGGITDKYSKVLTEPSLLGDLFVLQDKGKGGGWCWDAPLVTGNMPSPRESHSAVAYTEAGRKCSHKLIIFGGMCGGGRFNDVYIFDVIENSWIQPILNGVPPFPRSCHSATMLGSRMFVFGGWIHPPSRIDPVTGEPTANGKKQCSNELFFLNLNTWSWEQPRREGIWPAARAAHSACGTQASTIYVWSGATALQYPDGKALCHKDFLCLVVESLVDAPAGGVRLISQLDDNGFKLEWNPAEGADSYILQICQYLLPDYVNINDSSPIVSKPLLRVATVFEKTTPPPPPLGYSPHYDRPSYQFRHGLPGAQFRMPYSTSSSSSSGDFQWRAPPLLPPSYRGSEWLSPYQGSQRRAGSMPASIYSGTLPYSYGGRGPTSGMFPPPPPRMPLSSGMPTPMPFGQQANQNQPRGRNVFMDSRMINPFSQLPTPSPHMAPPYHFDRSRYGNPQQASSSGSLPRLPNQATFSRQPTTPVSAGIRVVSRRVDALDQLAAIASNQAPMINASRSATLDRNPPVAAINSDNPSPQKSNI